MRSVPADRRDAADHPHRRALAGAVRAEEAEGLARLDVEVDPVDRDEVAEALDEAARVDHGAVFAHGLSTYLCRPDGLSGRFDVAGDLVDQLLLGLEHLLVPQPFPQLDDDPLAVEVALEVEQVRLDPALLAAVVRIRADRDRGAVVERRRRRRCRTRARAAPARPRGSPSDSRVSRRAGRRRRPCRRAREAVRAGAPPPAPRLRAGAGGSRSTRRLRAAAPAVPRSPAARAARGRRDACGRSGTRRPRRPRQRSPAARGRTAPAPALPARA